LFTFVAEKKVV